VDTTFSSAVAQETVQNAHTELKGVHRHALVHAVEEPGEAF